MLKNVVQGTTTELVCLFFVKLKAQKHVPGKKQHGMQCMNNMIAFKI